MAIRVLCIGTSLTNGGGWVAPLQAELQKWTAIPVQTVNRGIGGAASDVGVRNIANYIACDPSIVLIEFGMNDAHKAKGIDPNDAVRNARQIIDAIKTAKPGCICAMMTTNTVWHDLAKPSHAGNNIDLDKLKRVYNAYHSMAYTNDGRVFRTVELQSYFDAMDATFPVALDGVHPSASSWLLMVPHIAAVIGPALRVRGTTFRNVTSPATWTPVT